MPIIAKKTGGGGDFELAPGGVHSAVCCDVVDLGVMEVSFGGKNKKQHKIRIVWQIDEKNSKGKRHTLRKRYTLSLHEKAALRKDLEAWRGKAFEESDLEGFDVETVIGVPCLISVIHERKEAETYANINSIMKLPKGMEALGVMDYTREKDRTQAEPVGHEAPPPFGDMTDDDVPF